MIERVIKINNRSVNKECGLCKKPADFRTGPQLFRADNWSLVCHTCGGEHNPELVHIIPEVRDAFAQLDYIESLHEFREREAQGEDIFPFDEN